jgi:hypothetical protein
MKRCEGPCALVKPLGEFPTHPKAKDGHMRICLTCGQQNGFTSRSKKRQQMATALAPSAPGVIAAVAPPSITPLFLAAGAYRFGLSSIALVDVSRPGHVEVRLSIHEVNARTGYPEALAFSFEGAEARLFLAALDGCTGQANAEVEMLRETIRQLKTERDAALQLALDLEDKQRALRAALGV